MTKNICLMFLMVFSANTHAASLQPSDSEFIESAGLPLHATAIFVSGNNDVGFRFASSSPPEEIQTWYRQQLPKWALFNEFGSWILSDGERGMGMGELMGKNQVSIRHNESLPQWHSLDKNMTTEIVIMIVQ